MRKYKNKLKQEFYNGVYSRVLNDLTYVDIELTYKTKGLSLMARQAVIYNVDEDIAKYKASLLKEVK